MHHIFLELNRYEINQLAKCHFKLGLVTQILTISVYKKVGKTRKEQPYPDNFSISLSSSYKT